MSVTRSKVDPDRMITSHSYVLSLITKPQGANPEHAFLVVEGKEEKSNNLIFRRYDFVVNRNAAPKTVVSQGGGQVVIKELVLILQDHPSEEAQKRYFWTNIMNDIEEKQGCDGISWEVKPAKIQVLKDNVAASQVSPPNYQISGEHSLFASSSSQSGHNCYTWARNMVLKMGDDNIKHDDRLKVLFSDYLAAQVTKHINLPGLDEEPNSLKICRIL